MALLGARARVACAPTTPRDLWRPRSEPRSTTVSETDSIEEIAAAELRAVVDDGALVLDVRMPDEYEAAHVPGALLIPLPEIQERHAEIPDADTVYVICRSGGRSLVASQFLLTLGRVPVNVAGGTDGWIQAGHPVATGPELS